VNRISRVLAVAVVALAARPAAAAPPADLAELFPPNTLAYAEVVNPAELASELAAVFKGTVVEDGVALVHGRKDAAKNLMELTGKQNLALLGLVASPEMLAEFKRLRVAVALTGFTDAGDPEVALVVLTHDSPAAGLAARAYLTMSPNLRRVGEVAKVPVFQHRQPNINYDNNGVPAVKNDQPPTDGPNELTVAYTPGLVVIGSNKAAIGHAIRRFAGEEHGGGLGKEKAFRDAAAAHRQTGLFYYVNYTEFVVKLRAANKQSGRERGIGELIAPLAGAADLDPLAWFNLAANPNAVKTLAGCVRFRDGGVSATAAVRLDPAQKSPLSDVLSGPGVKAELLHHARGPVTFAVAVTFPEKNRGAAVLSFLDAVVKAGGELGRLPGEAVREWEQKLKVPVTDSLLGRTRAATVFAPKNPQLPKGAKPMPVFVLHTEDDGAAEAWETFFPRMFGELAGAGKAAEPSSDTTDGVKVFTVPGAGLPWNAPVHYARKGPCVAVGLDRKLVAAAVTADVAASPAGGGKAVSPPGKDIAAFGVVSVGDVLGGLLDRPKPSGPVVPKENEVQLFTPNGNPLPEEFVNGVKKARKDLVAAVAALPAATLTAARTAEEVRIELFLPGVRTGSLKLLVNAAADWLDKSGGLAGFDRNGRFHPHFER